MQKKLIPGILLTLLSAFAYALQTSLIKFMPALPSVPMLVFTQSVIGWITMTAIIAFTPSPTPRLEKMKTQQWGLHFIRTIASLSVSYLLFTALHTIPLVDGVLLANTSPLFIPFLSFLIFRHPINHRLWPSLAVGFLGVVLILRPDHGLLQLASWFALGAGICIAISIFISRMTAKHDKAETIAFFFFGISTLVSGLVAIPFWKMPVGLAWVWLLVNGLLVVVVQYLLSLAVRISDAQTVTIVYYSNILFAAFINIALGKGSLELWTLAGMAMIIGGGIASILSHQRHQQKLATRA